MQEYGLPRLKPQRSFLHPDGPLKKCLHLQLIGCQNVKCKMSSYIQNIEIKVLCFVNNNNAQLSNNYTLLSIVWPLKQLSKKIKFD